MLPGRPTGRDWTGPSADGDSPVVVRARVGPAGGSSDVTPTPGEGARLGLRPQEAPVLATVVFAQEAAS